MGLHGLTSTKLGLMCLAQVHNVITPVRLEPAAPRSPVKHSTTEPLRSSFFIFIINRMKSIKQISMCL